MLASALVNLTLIISTQAEAAVESVKAGESHDSIWRSADVGLFLDESLLEVPGAMDAMSSALEIWDADSRLPHVWPLLGDTDAVGYRDGQTNRNTIRFAARGDPTAKGALAITLVSYEGEERTIIDGDIVINGLYGFADLRDKGKSSSSGNHSVYDLTDVLMHELGHWFGLPDAPEDPNAVMYPYFGAGETRALSLGEGDRKALDALYASTAQTKSQPACSIAGHSSGNSSYMLVFATVGALGRWRRRARHGRRAASF